MNSLRPTNAVISSCEFPWRIEEMLDCWNTVSVQHVKFRLDDGWWILTVYSQKYSQQWNLTGLPHRPLFNFDIPNLIGISSRSSGPNVTHPCTDSECNVVLLASMSRISLRTRQTSCFWISSQSFWFSSDGTSDVPMLCRLGCNSWKQLIFFLIISQLYLHPLSLW